MTKYRIIRKIEVPINKEKPDERWIIEMRTFFGWREITNEEGPKTVYIEHESYAEAEQYLFKNYIRSWGYCTVNGNVYSHYLYSYSI